jgi:hypothetical protein
MTADLRYPVGRFDWTAPVDPSLREPAIATIAALPAWMREAVADLNDAQLDTPYRPGGWTVRQVVHHVADSHANAYIRLKVALTEDEPTIKPYDQDSWAALSDMKLPIEISLGLIDGLHARWAALYRSMSPAQFSRTFNHPEIGVVTLDAQVQSYAWHSRHHLAHITGLRTREGW